MGKFVVSVRKNGEFQFNLQASNGQTILTSEGYSSKAACLNGVESVKKNALDDARYERKTTTSGKHHFNLTSTNGQVVGSSQTYESQSGMETGIASVKTNAPDAQVEEA
ncbi:MAG TPA: YegP family protein [Cyclobacteriaceae bacterium]|nr:YegP family protein [Cyclobacteriaceae bacterium]